MDCGEAQGVLPYRLIMVVGSGPGAGKSTFSDFIYRRLLAEGLPVEWFYESDVFRYEPVRRFGETFHTAPEGLLNTFREGALLLAGEWRGSRTIRVLDSYLPGYFWLLHAVALPELEAFGDELWELLRPLDPLILYCRADVRAAWRRAVNQRGAAWGEGLWRHVGSWNMPHYSGGPLRTEEDVLGYFAWLDEMSLRLLERWPGRVVTVDTLAPRVAVEAELLAALGLASLPPAPAPTAEELRPYIGRYVPEAGRGAPVTVTLEGCTLHASLFWQAGTALEPETGDLFQVRAASATVRFLRDEAGALCGLEYTHFFGTQRYVRAP